MGRKGTGIQMSSARRLRRSSKTHAATAEVKHLGELLVRLQKFEDARRGISTGRGGYRKPLGSKTKIAPRREEQKKRAATVGRVGKRSLKTKNVR